MLLVYAFLWCWDSWVVFVVHVVFVVLKATADFVLQYRKQQIQPIQLIQLQVLPLRYQVFPRFCQFWFCHVLISIGV